LVGEVTEVESGRWEYVGIEGEYRFVAHVRDTQSTFEVVSVTVARADAEGLTARELRNAPYGRWITEARDAVEKVPGRRRMMLRPSDPPRVFMTDRRGKAPRSDVDYAVLAQCYLAASPGRRRRLASEWAERFPGVAKRTWMKHLGRAKRDFITSWVDVDTGEEVVGLSEAWPRVVYGEDWESRLDSESELDAAVHRFRMLTNPRSAVERAAVTAFRRHHADPEDAARRLRDELAQALPGDPDFEPQGGV
jgi:hypothetical protein